MQNQSGDLRTKNVVCFGGGTGLPSLLSGLGKNPWFNVTAIVNMFDSGGSSGELRDRFGILPPGDILKCMLALSAHENFARELLLKRISNHKYAGHTGGNVLLLGLEKVFEDYLQAVDALGQILSIRGKVIPVTLEKAGLNATYEDGTIFSSETGVDFGIKEGKKVRRISLEPENINCCGEAEAAIKRADIICIGPGSFYTSILPNFLPRGISQAIAESKAPLIFTANLVSEGKGMQGMYLEDYVRILEEHAGRKIDHVIANTAVQEELMGGYAQEGKTLIKAKSEDPRFIFAPLWTDNKYARHDSARLANIIWGIAFGT